MQKFVGLDPRTRLLRWGLAALALGVALGGTLPSAVDQLALALATQHDSLPWYGSRVLGFLAYLAIAGSVVYGLLLSTGILDRIAHRPITFALHQDLGSAGLGLAGVHGALLGLDRVVPVSLAELAVPFAAPYRPLWVGIGQVTFYLTLVVVASFYLRRRIGQRTWRRLHYLTFLTFAGATAHGLMSGTDTGAPWALWLYAGVTAGVVFLLTYRIVLAGGKRSGVVQRESPESISRRAPAPGVSARYGRPIP
jgi:methionine sulfoxide reductase heme-binding subunit